MSHSKSIKIYLVTVLVVFSLLLNGMFKVDAAPEKSTCEKQVPFLNLRAQLLERLRYKQDQAYLSKRKVWSQRIAYSGQWVPKDAEKAREALYKYDQAHKAYSDELDKQKDIFIPLETNPLNCTDAKKADREKYYKLSKGESKNKGKDLSGQYKLFRLAKNETKYSKQEFKKVSEKMMKNQQKAKKKNPKPQKSMTLVEDYNN